MNPTLAPECAEYLLERYGDGNRFVHSRLISNDLDVRAAEIGKVLAAFRDNGLLDVWGRNGQRYLYKIPDGFPDLLADSSLYNAALDDAIDDAQNGAHA